MRRWFKAAKRLALFSAVTVACTVDFAKLSLARRRRLTETERAAWLHRWCVRGLRALEVSVQYEGSLPASGLLVSNHLSYLDILVFSSILPCVFVSKSEVRNWPVFGWLARLAGTVFIDRGRRGDTVRVNAELAEAFSERDVVVLFPEGTSSDGSRVLRFHSSLFQPAIDAGQPITAAHIAYTMRHGDPATEICYWGDMTLAPHFFKFLSHGGASARVHFSTSAKTFTERKAAASATWQEVVALGGGCGNQASAPARVAMPSESTA